MRKLFASVLTLAIALLLASPASAKGINYAHFSGPGLPPGGLTLHGEHQQLWQTGLVGPKGLMTLETGYSRADLGPAYRASYRMDYLPRITLHQVVYPYAEGGPRTYTPPGQHVGQDYESFRGGWFIAHATLLTFLTKHGFPATNPTAKPVSQAQPASQGIADTSGSSWVWAFVVAGALALLLGGMFASRRARRAR